MRAPENVYLCTDSAGQYKLVCYFTNWAWYRPGPGKYIPEDTDTNLCTHIVYGFIVLDGDQFTVRIHDSWADVDNSNDFDLNYRFE